MSDQVEASADDTIWRDKRLAKGTLAQLWDSQAALRQRMHDQDFPYLTRWLRNSKTKQLAIGVPSVKAMALNVTALEQIAEWYCPVQPYPKAICIDVLRREAGVFPQNCLVWTGSSITSITEMMVLTFRGLCDWFLKR